MGESAGSPGSMWLGYLEIHRDIGLRFRIFDYCESQVVVTFLIASAAIRRGLSVDSLYAMAVHRMTSISATMSVRDSHLKIR